MHSLCSADACCSQTRFVPHVPHGWSRVQCACQRPASRAAAAAAAAAPAAPTAPAAAPAPQAAAAPEQDGGSAGRLQQPRQQQQQQQQPQPQQQLPHGLQPHQLPRHVAIIMDGNSRWAARRGLPAFAGHERGVAALKQAVTTARGWGIPALTVFAFSAENWAREPSEVAFLMDLFSGALQQQLPELVANGVRLSFMGQLHRLPPRLRAQAAACEAATAGCAGLLLSVAVSYSGQADVAQAAQQLARDVQAGRLVPEQITPELISRRLSSAPATAAVGPPDLIIRSSEEQRLSNFMLYEAAYAELCFLDVMWPDFGEQHFAAALQQYVQRQRRFGRRQR